MARTKQTARKAMTNQSTSGKAPRKQLTTKTARKTSAVQSQSNTGKKTHRFKPGAYAIKEIKKYQKSTELLLRKLPFQRLCRDITKNIKSEARFQLAALAALQETTENFIVTMCEEAHRCAVHGKRVTVMKKDLALVKKLKYSSLLTASI